MSETPSAICAKYGATPDPPKPFTKVGISQSARDGVRPLYGLRHLAVGDANGWMIWGGEYSPADDFFMPLHAEHLDEWCPDALPFLNLPPGWGFIWEPGYEDVWFDERIRVE